MTSKAVASDSIEQREAEIEMLAALGERLGVVFSPKTISIDEKSRLEIDGASESPLILCEVFAHHGKPKGSQPKKVIADAFKLLYAERLLGFPARKIILLADEEAAACFKASSWFAHAFRANGVEVQVVALNADTHDRVRGAQLRQYR